MATPINPFQRSQTGGVKPPAIVVAITSPSGGASVTAGAPVTISGTLSSSAIIVQVKLGATVLGSASIVGLNWSYSWTPQAGDIGAQTLNVAATSVNGDTGPTASVAVTVVASTDLSSFFTAGTVLQSVQTDKGLTTGATLTWTDQSGNGKHYTQSTAGKQPTLTTGLNGNPGLRFTAASQQVLTSALNLPAPGTTPTWIGLVWRNITPNGNGRPIADTSTGISCIAYMSAADTKLQLFNGGAGPISATVTANTWGCDEFYFSNSSSDYIKRGSAAAVSGAGASNGTGVGRSLGGSDGSVNYIDGEILHVIYVSGAPQTTAIANWRAAVASKYGGSVSV